jgi:hypothetical protein
MSIKTARRNGVSLKFHSYGSIQNKNYAKKWIYLIKNTPCPLLPRGGKPSGIDLLPKEGRGCCLIYILLKSEITVYC